MKSDLQALYARLRSRQLFAFTRRQVAKAFFDTCNLTYLRIILLYTQMLGCVVLFVFYCAV